MKSIIVREVTSLVLRPSAPTAATTSSSTHIRFNDATSSSSATPHKSKLPEPKKETNTHARYYATITYNQIVLTPGDREVALQLVDVYFEMFKELLGEGNSSDEVKVLDDVRDKGDGKRDKARKEEGRKGHVRAKGKAKAKEVKGDAGFAEVEDEHSKLISAILTGVNRALPFAKISSADVGLVLFYNDLLYYSLDSFSGSTNTSTLYFSSHTHLPLIYPSSPSFLSNNSHLLYRPRRTWPVRLQTDTSAHSTPHYMTHGLHPRPSRLCISISCSRV